jgi:NAD dependent epimerase/dehydratase family enzyme
VKWLLAGASGFLGTAIRVRLASEGQPVVRLVRREPATSTEFRWDPDSGEIDLSAFDGVDVVVNLGGVPVAPLPWTDSRRQQILTSRVNTTSTIARGLAAQADSRPRTLIQLSGIARLWHHLGNRAKHRGLTSGDRLPRPGNDEMGGGH